jgi:hypothetical protein
MNLMLHVTLMMFAAFFFFNLGISILSASKKTEMLLATSQPEMFHPQEEIKQ